MRQRRQTSQRTRKTRGQKMYAACRNAYDANTIYRLQFELGAKTKEEVSRASSSYQNIILIRHPLHR
jgi:hypothetical protein